MDFLELAKKRHSVRKFTDQKIEKEKINAIIEAGHVAPTAVNYQPQRYLIIESDEGLNKLKTCTRFHFDAPLAILVCYDNNVSWKRSYDNKEMGEVDTAIVTTHMMLEIENLGLGTTWVGHFDPNKMIETFNLPENIKPVALLPIGYPHEESKPHPFHDTFVDLESVITYNSF